MKKSKTKVTNGANVFKKYKKIFICLAVLIVAIGGFVALKLSMAAPFDGWQRLRVVNVATQQIGHREWDPQVLAYSENNNENWCADFVSWVYATAGYPLPGGSVAYKRSAWRIPRVYNRDPSAPNLRDIFIFTGTYKTKESGYVPAPGDVIIFARAGVSHTGIVENTTPASKSSPVVVNTIEGNTANQVARRSYSINDAKIDGYGTIIDLKRW